MKRTMHPNSLANLKDGRPPLFDEKKKVRAVSVTQTGWDGILQAAEAVGCDSISEFLERLGRGEVEVSAKASN